MKHNTEHKLWSEKLIDALTSSAFGSLELEPDEKGLGRYSLAEVQFCPHEIDMAS